MFPGFVWAKGSGGEPQFEEKRKNSDKHPEELDILK